MNCQLCKNESEAYRSGNLPEGIKARVENHLKECVDCARYYSVVAISERVIEKEKIIAPNPFLSTRVMASIEALGKKPVTVHKNVLKPALIGFSVAAAILSGIFLGNLYRPMRTVQQVPVEMIYMNDVALESINLISKD